MPHCFFRFRLHPLIFFLKLFIYLWLTWVFTAAPALSLVVVSGVYSSLWGSDFPPQWLLLWSLDLSSCGPWALECGLSSCGQGLCCSEACRSFLDQGWNRVPCIGRQIFNLWTTREVPILWFLLWKMYLFLTSCHSHHPYRPPLSPSSQNSES